MRKGADTYTRGVFFYPNATCSFKVGPGVKTEGDLVVSGTKGYAYVPAPLFGFREYLCIELGKVEQVCFSISVFLTF